KYPPRPLATIHGLDSRSAETTTTGYRTPRRKNDAISATMNPVADYVPYFRNRHWRLEISRTVPFLTSDAPLVLWRPPSKEDDYRGFGLLEGYSEPFAVV
ncbi:hypothetical protein ABIA33_006558, partial [Streptacidiphilus sp. MAP12-16]